MVCGCGQDINHTCRGVFKNMADEEIREKIKDALRNGPMTAVDIAKKIGKDKKDINRVIYKILEVESISATKPPLWKLKSTTSDSATDSTPTVDPTPPSATPVSSAGATPIKEKSKTDLKLKERINQLLTTDPQSAPDIHRKLNDASVAMKDVKSILYNSGIAENTAPAGQKPLYVKKGFKKPTKLQHDGGPIYTKKETNDGTISFVPLTDTVYTDTDIKSSSTGGKGGKEEEEVKSKLDVSSQKSPDSAPLPSNGSSCHPPTDGISSLSLDDNNLKDAVLKHVKDNKEKCFKAGDLMETLGQTTRDGIMYCLKELAKEGKIEENNDGTFKALSNEN